MGYVYFICVRTFLLSTLGHIYRYVNILKKMTCCRFLYEHVAKYRKSPNKSIFQPSEGSSKLLMKSNLKLHLYISTAPCGDGALFTHKLVPILLQVFIA